MEEYLHQCKKTEKDPIVFGYIDRMLTYKRDGIWSSYNGITSSDDKRMMITVLLNDETVACMTILDLLRNISTSKANIALLSIYSPYTLVFMGDLSKLRDLLSKYNSKYIKGSIIPIINRPDEDIYHFVAETNLPTTMGTFRMLSYRNNTTHEEPIVLITGNIEGSSNVLVRVHDQCATSEVFGSLRCDCKEQLDSAMTTIQSLGKGMIIYLPQEGRGIGIANKIAAYSIQELGVDTVDANRLLGLPDDDRKYKAVKDILDDMDIKSISLMTNNPRKIEHLTKLGIKISSRISCIVKTKSDLSSDYITTKIKRMGHLIPETYSHITSCSKEHQ